MYKYYRLILLLLLSSYSYGQFTQVAIPPGYTNTQARFRNDLLIDQQNNYWVAFDRIGLGKYTSGTWTMYDSLTAGLPSNKILSVAESPSGNIIAAYPTGISIYNGASWNHFDHVNSLLPDSGIATVEAVANNIWVGTNTGIYIYDGNTWNHYSTTTSGLINDTVVCITYWNGLAAIGTRNGLSVYDGAQLQWENFSINGDPGAGHITDVAINNVAEVWVVNKLNKVYFIDNSTSALTPFDSIVPQPNFECNPAYFNIEGIEVYNGDIILQTESPPPFLLLKINSNHELFYAEDAPPTTMFRITNNFAAFISALGAPFNFQFYVGSFLAFAFEPLTSYYFGQFEININKVRARVYNNGAMHWDPIGQTPYHEVPKCSNTNSVYCSGLWIGGYDSNNQLHVAAEMYRNGGRGDYWTGPLDTLTGLPDSATAQLFDKSWKINRHTIEEFKSNYISGNVTNGSYIIPDVLLKWPANSSGNTTRELAPYYDNNADDIYNPLDGDYPCITGDQYLWFVYNDVINPHWQSFAPALGIEVQGNAYAFDGTPYPDTSALDYTTFYHFKITNRSDTTYHDVYIGMFTDTDLGNAADDYVQCNPKEDYGFVLNGDSIDEGAQSYGNNPPIQNVAVLKGPLADTNDGIDNNHNGVTDETDEINMMTSFRWIGGINWNEIPQTADDFMEYMTGKWVDGMPLTFGNMGHNTGSTQNTMYAFPGTEDFNFPGQNWTMFNSGYPPDDMRMCLSSGPFTLSPGESKTFDVAYIFTRDSSGGVYPDAAITHNKAEVVKVKKFWKDHPSQCNKISVPAEPEITTPEIFFFPNPAQDEIGFTAPEADFNGAQFEIYNAIGQIVRSGTLTSRKFSVRNLSSQLYIVKIINKDQEYFGKFVKE